MKARSKYLLPVLAFLVIALAAVVLVLYFTVLRPKPEGGTLYKPDLNGGYQLYVREGYTQELGCTDDSQYNGRYAQQVLIESPHTLWHVTDGETREQFCTLCGEIKSIRQIHGNTDELMGAYLSEVGPSLYLDAGGFGYSISVSLWGSMEGGVPPIFSEVEEGTPVLCFRRMDMSENIDDLAIYDYTFGNDFMDEDDIFGWYSTMPLDAYQKLIALIDSLDDTNSVAEIAYT